MEIQPETIVPTLPLADLAAQIAYAEGKFQSKILLDRNQEKVILSAFAQGQELKTHTTPKDALLVMLEGECSFLFSEENVAQTLKAGHIIRIPATVPHALKALTNFKMVLMK